MKTIKYLTLRLMAVAAIAIAFALPAKAQVTPFTYFNVDWQFNAPISNNFANKASGWGMNFEGGYIYCRICQSVPLSIIIPIMSIFHVRHYQSATRQP